MNTHYLATHGNVLLASGVTITPENENADFPKENLIALPLSQKFRSQAPGTAFDIDFDLPAAVDVDTVAVIAHNVPSGGGGRIRFYSGAANTLRGELAFNRYESRISFFFRSSAVNASSFRLRFTPGGAGFIQVGYVLMGVSTELPYNWSNPKRIERIKRQRFIESELGDPIIGDTVFDSAKITLSFNSLVEDEADTIEEFLRGLDLQRYPILLAPEGADSPEIFFCRLTRPQARITHTATEDIETEWLTDPIGRDIG